MSRPECGFNDSHVLQVVCSNVCSEVVQVVRDRFDRNDSSIRADAARLMKHIVAEVRTDVNYSHSGSNHGSQKGGSNWFMDVVDSKLSRNSRVERINSHDP